MKRTIVVFGVLAAFLFATFGAYAVENSTWGRIKACFVESPTSEAVDSAPVRLAKPGGRHALQAAVWESPTDYWYKEQMFNANQDDWMQLNKTRLEVPAGALEKNTKLSLKITKEAPSGLGALNRTYDFGPHNTVFLKSLTLKLYFGDVDLSGVSVEDLQMYYYNEATGQWEWMGGIVVDTAGNQIVFTGFISHFSRYALGQAR